jgi:hypothetical protein
MAKPDGWEDMTPSEKADELLSRMLAHTRRIARSLGGDLPPDPKPEPSRETRTAEAFLSSSLRSSSADGFVRGYGEFEYGSPMRFSMRNRAR